MKKIKLLLLFFLPLIIHAQFGIKAGLNFANVSNAASINSSSQSGFHIGFLLAPAGKGVIGSRTELLFSKQGYNYKSSANSGTVNLNYITLQQGMSINISKYFSLLGGAQTAYLLNARVDSSANNGGSSPYGNIMNLYNRFDYGLGLGAEVHPAMGLLMGIKYNVSFAKIYKSVQTGQLPSFSAEDSKNNVVQIYAGWRFGENKDKFNK